MCIGYTENLFCIQLITFVLHDQIKKLSGKKTGFISRKDHAASLNVQDTVCT